MIAQAIRAVMVHVMISLISTTVVAKIDGVVHYAMVNLSRVVTLTNLVIIHPK